MKLITFLLCMIGFLLFPGCSKDDENGTDDDNNVSDEDIVVKMTVYGDESHLCNISFGLDGNWVENEITGSYGKNPYTLFLTEFNTISFPKDLTINWGDGTETSSTTHDYEKNGVYQITLKCKELRCLNIEGELTGIDLSQAVDLECLRIEKENRWGDKLKTLDVSRNKKLKLLDYSDTDLPFVDVSNNTKLMYLDFSDNGFSHEYRDLDFSKNTELRYLDCSWTGVKSLYIRNCKELIYLSAGDSNLSDEMANKVYNDLPQGKTWKEDEKDYSSKVDIGYYDRYGDQKWHDQGDISIAKRKGWNQYESYY